MNGPQAGEGPLLHALLPSAPVIYVDIGAAEPAECSMTWPFYQEGGYGLLVEPRLDMAAQLMKHRPRDITIPVAAWNCHDRLTMMLAAGASSLRRDWPSPPPSGEVEVCAVPTSQILDCFPHIRDACQLCSIDVEGSERQVLDGIDWRTFHPSLIIIEYITWDPQGPGVDVSHEWVEYFTKAGYAEVSRSWLNIIFGTPEMCRSWESLKHEVPPPHSYFIRDRK